MKLGWLPRAGCALAVVGLFEVLNGFHLMIDACDPAEYAANAAGIGLAGLAAPVTAGLAVYPAPRRRSFDPLQFRRMGRAGGWGQPQREASDDLRETIGVTRGLVLAV